MEMCAVESTESSSRSSSPQSNTSSEEQIIKNHTAANEAGFLSNPIYNFSIPDIIKHETRQNCDMLSRSFSESQSSDANQCSIINQSRKRGRKKQLAQSGMGSMKCDEMQSGSSDKPTGPERPRTRKRRLLEQDLKKTTSDSQSSAGNLPQVIDLTELDTAADGEGPHESHAASHAEVELIDGVEIRPLHHLETARSFHDMVLNKERFRRHLQDTHNRIQCLMHDNVYGSSDPRHHHRRSRNFSHLFPQCSIISDGPLVTEHMIQARATAVSVPTSSSASQPPVVSLVEDDSSSPSESQDQEIAQRMALDPSFSSPFLSPHRLVIKPSRRRHSRNRQQRLNRDLFRDDGITDFGQLRRGIQNIQMRSRDHLEEVRRINQHTEGRLARLRESMYELRRRHNQILNLEEAVLNGGTENPGGSASEHAHSNDSAPLEIIVEHSDEEVDDVQFIGEWNPRNLDYLQSALQGDLPTLATANASSDSPHLVGRHMSVPDFLTPLMSTVLGPTMPRLRHVGEDYEALWNFLERIGPAKPRGLSKPECDLIPSFRYNSTNSCNTNAKCVVCMSDYSNREKLRRLPCSHDFHARCIDKWLKSTRTCPVCRDEVKIKTE